MVIGQDVPVYASPDGRWTWLQVGLAAALLTAVPWADPAGRLLLVPAGLLLAALGVRDLVLRPVLAADATGLRLVQGLHHREVPWSSVEGMRVVTDRRAPLLELDLGRTVVVLSRSRLGRAPYLVLADLEATRAPPGAPDLPPLSAQP